MSDPRGTSWQPHPPAADERAEHSPPAASNGVRSRRPLWRTMLMVPFGFLAIWLTFGFLGNLFDNGGAHPYLKAATFCLIADLPVIAVLLVLWRGKSPVPGFVPKSTPIEPDRITEAPRDPARRSTVRGTTWQFPESADSPSASAEKSPESSARDEKRSAPEISLEIEGIVQNVNRSSQTVGWKLGTYGQKLVSEQVMTFRVEVRDAQGDIAERVPVEIRGESISGDLANGDRVRFRKNQARGMQLLQSVQSLTTSSSISCGRSRSSVAARLPSHAMAPSIGKGTYQGIVRSLTRTTQSATKGYFRPTEQILSFRIEVGSVNGKMLEHQVEMRGQVFSGDLAEGDRVRFVGAGGGLQRLTDIYNETNDSYVIVRPGSLTSKVGILVVVVVIVLFLVILISFGLYASSQFSHFHR